MPRRMRGLYKQAHSAVWWCCYKSASGRMIRKSTGKTEYDEAVDFLVSLRTQVKAGIDPEFKKIVSHTFSELAKQYGTWCKRQRGSIAKQRCINQLVDKFGDLPLRQFSTMLIEQYQTERLEKGKRTVRVKVDKKTYVEETRPNKPATINRHVATLKHAFTKAVEWDMVEEEVLKKVRKAKMLPENNRRLRYLSKEECQALIEHCSGQLKAMVITALHTGMRRGEIFSLTWDQIDLKHGFVLLEKTKNGERREIPINAALREALGMVPRRLDGGHVFINQESGLPYCTFNKAFLRACRQSGVTNFRFHDLRHTFASHLVMAGQDITTVKELLGHKTLTMTLRYAHLAPSHKVRALDVLNETLAGASTSYLLHTKGGK